MPWIQKSLCNSSEKPLVIVNNLNLKLVSTIPNHRVHNSLSHRHTKISCPPLAVEPPSVNRETLPSRLLHENVGPHVGDLLLVLANTLHILRAHTPCRISSFCLLELAHYTCSIRLLYHLPLVIFQLNEKLVSWYVALTLSLVGLGSLRMSKCGGRFMEVNAICCDSFIHCAPA